MSSFPKDEVYWQTFKKPKVMPLKKDSRADIAIVGGGVTGLSAAQSFAEKGFDVAIIERDFCGAGASGKSSGFITPDSEFGLSDFIKRFGKKPARKLWEFGNDGVEFIRRNIRKNKLECDYIKQDAIFVANKKKHLNSVEEEFKARKELHYTTSIYSSDRLENVIGTKGYCGGVRYYNTFAMNSYLYCQGMKDALKIKIFEKTDAVGIKDNCISTNTGYKIKADKIIVCADRFTPDLRKNDKDFYQVQTYLLVSAPLNKNVMQKIFPEKQIMVWDSDLNYQYFRPLGGNRILLGGGDIITLYNKKLIRNNKRVFQKLTRYFSKKFPNIRIRWEYMWPGALGISKDFLPIISVDKEMPDVYYLGAGAGLPWSAGIGNYIAQKITNGKNDFDSFFNNTRKFPPPSAFQNILGKKIAFSLCHGYIKFLEK